MVALVVSLPTRGLGAKTMGLPLSLLRSSVGKAWGFFSFCKAFIAWENDALLKQTFSGV